MKTHCLLPSLVITALLPAISSAALVTFSFTGSTANAIGPFSPENPAVGVSASNLTGTNMGTGGVTFSGGVVTSFANPTDASLPAYVFDGAGYEVAASVTSNDSAGTIDTTPLSTFSFTITPTSTPILYSSLTLDFGWDFTTTANGTNMKYDLYYSIGGGIFAQAGNPSTLFGDNSHSVTNDLTTNLSTLAAFVAPVSDAVTFELRFADTSSSLNTKRLFIDDINLNGTVIPEPGSTMLLLGGALALGFRRSRMS